MQSGKGGEVRTLFAGDGTEEVRTVIVTFPPETVIVTVPVGFTDEATDPGTVDIPDTDVTTAGPEVTEKPGKGYEYTMHTYERSLGGGSTASFTSSHFGNGERDASDEDKHPARRHYRV